MIDNTAEQINIDDTKVDNNIEGFIIHEVISDNRGRITDPEELKREWKAIDDMVFLYQKQFKYDYNEKGKRVCVGVNTDLTEDEIQESKMAGFQLLNDFNPIIKKYVNLFKTGQINFADTEQKSFVYLFMDSKETKNALWRKNISKEMRDIIFNKFNFVCECYGKRDKDDMVSDLQTILLELAKRYKDTGKSFCAFLYKSFSYTVARKIVKPYQKEVLNFHYKKVQFDDYANSTIDDICLEDEIYEDEMGIPDITWTQGSTCSDIFSSFTAEERNILAKYYLAGWNDSQIADSIGMHINTVNTKRRKCLKVIAEKTGMNLSDIKRNRRSGKKAIGNTI